MAENKDNKDPTRVKVLADIEECERLGQFDRHTDPIDLSCTLPVDKNFKYIRKGFFDKTRVFLQRMFIVYPFAKRVSKSMLKVEVKGKENIKGIESAILTSNHVNKFDCLAIQNTMMPKKTYVVAAEFNNVSGHFGEMMRVGGMLPLSSDFAAKKNFLKAVEYYLEKKCFVLIYPEEAMWWNYEKPRPYKEGAFVLAVKNNVPIVPIFISFRRSGIIDANGIEIKYLTINIMKPIYKRDDLSYRKNIEYLRKANEAACREKYEEIYKCKLTFTLEKEPGNVNADISE